MISFAGLLRWTEVKCVRMIDADELKKSMERMLCTGKEPDKERYTYDVVCCVIDEEPFVDAEPVRHGRWIPTRPYLGSTKCSICGKVWGIESPYCPSCGAKMDEGEQNAAN